MSASRSNIQYRGIKQQHASISNQKTLLGNDQISNIYHRIEMPYSVLLEWKFEREKLTHQIAVPLNPFRDCTLLFVVLLLI